MTSESTLTVFVPVRLTNPLNAREHWTKRAKRAQTQRDAVSHAVWVALHEPVPQRWKWTIASKPSDPKRITLTAHTVRVVDDDAIPAMCKAVRDGLMDSGLVDGDAPSHGHTWRYRQVQDGRRGVTVRVTRRA